MQSRIRAGRRRTCTAFIEAVVIIALVALAACEDSREAPARAAIAQIDRVVADAGDAPSKYIPGDLRNVETRVERLKRQFDLKHYATVLDDAPAVLAQARALKTTAATREAELSRQLQAEWAGLERDLPGALAATRARVQAVQQKPSRATGLSREQLAYAARQVETADALWQRASSEHDAQRLPEAVTLAGQVRELLHSVEALPGLAAPGAGVQ
jgi:hypothetical protein